MDKIEIENKKKGKKKREKGNGKMNIPYLSQVQMVEALGVGEAERKLLVQFNF